MKTADNVVDTGKCNYCFFLLLCVGSFLYSNEAIATCDKAMQEYIHAINELVRCEACSKLRWARKHLEGAVKVAKERWMQKTCKEIEDILMQ